MPSVRVLFATLATLFVPSAALVAAADVSPALRAQAEAVCRDDAIRLCADAISDEAAIVACMRPKRALLTGPCRKVFDAVVRDMGR
ncbi:hypothetical protein [Lichenibacterium ramalinae]|uniref:Cysteine rich repeat protein n=1 Tax=Lichenibacterium ramalinae TaxID=2316527 RepID=A0A4Q2RBT0_9HYPH|nr:hypothetical protein [Lichenibacterium ramalinae]RYB04376.1 hypothetical protein D3272_13050 [Lichenibacterium ramalinae]